MKRIWKIRRQYDAAKHLAEELKVHPVVGLLLAQRGFCEHSAAAQFIDPTFENLEEPSVFRDMPRAIEVIRLAISEQKLILIYGDYDADGITASAILYGGLKKFGARVEVYIPNRLTDGYGLNRKTLESLLKKKPGVVVAMDNGIGGAKEVCYLKENGVQVIIADHHLPKGDVPEADAVLNVCRMEANKSSANLAACGIAFKMVWALSGNLAEALSYLDLVTLGTVADLAPVLGDNRILLKEGLRSLAQSSRAGIKALIASAKISPKFLGYRDIAFGLGPRINASGRLGTPQDAFRLLTTDNLVEAVNLASMLEEGNKDRQRAEAKAFEEAVRIVEDDPAKDFQKILVVEHPDWHEGIIGIIAQRLVERYRKPAVAISLKEGQAKGSGRSLSSFSLFEHIGKCSEFLEGFGGHAQACGLLIKKENVGKFREACNQRLGDSVEEGLAQNVEIMVDTELKLHEIDLRLLHDLEKLAPFGPGNPKPLFLSRGVRLRGDLKKRGQDTLQGWITDAEGRATCEIIAFRAFERFRKSVAREQNLDIVYEPQIREYQGIATIQLGLEDWR